MIRAVFDSNVLMSALGWHNEAFRCLVLVARRRVRAYASDWICEEYRRIAQRMESEGRFPRSPWPTLEWFLFVCHIVGPAPLGKQRSRDPKDDPYLACALAAKARFIISYDSDLLDLQKPFGIEVLTPRALLNHVYSDGNL